MLSENRGALKLVVLSVALAGALWVAMGIQPRPHIDDAYISYRYAVNLAEGRGYVWNAGEYVEGTTNLLWTLLVAGGVLLGFGAVATAQGLSALFGAAAMAATAWYAWTLLPDRQKWWAAAAPWLVLCSISFLVYGYSGLETPLVAALVATVLAAEASDRLGFGTGAAILAFLARPDAGLLSLVLFGGHALRKGLDRRLIVWGSVFACAVAGVTAWRLYYFGSPVPNTFYAKVGDIPLMVGVDYVRRFFFQEGGLVLLAASVWVMGQRAAWPGVAFAVLSLAYVIWVGGDVFPFSRFLVPLWPALAALALAGIAQVPGKRKAVLATVLAMLVLVPVGIKTQLINIDRAGYEDRGRKAAAILNKEEPELIAACAIGALGYYCIDTPVLDMLGLCDKHIARSDYTVPGARLLPGHSKCDPDYVLERNPDVIFVVPFVDEDSVPAVYAIHNHPEFQRNYEWDEVLGAFRRRTAEGPEPAAK